MVRTSTSHPIRIDDLPLGNGCLGITFCPGKKGESVFGAEWYRDLDLDIDAIKAWGANAVLSLIEDHEFDMLGVPTLGAVVKSRGIDWCHFPIQDLKTPTDDAMGTWVALSAQLHATLERGGRVLVHCRGGLGRAGTIAALMLIERGLSAPQSISDVRAVRPGAIETADQERWVTHRARHYGLPGIRLHASLLAGAYGDSLGAEIEFLSLDAIRRQFPDGISDLPPHQGLRGAITDDSQMTLFTAEGLIRTHVRGALKGISHPPSVVHHALLRWYRTQGCKPHVETDNVGLITDRRLWARRAPGLTCLSSLGEVRSLGTPAKNDSKGCGTIMRVAPVALMVPRDQVRSIAIETSALTHGHPTGQLAAAAWAEMLADVATGAKLEEIAATIAGQYEQLKNGHETAHAIRKALDAPRDGSPETVETLGGGWTAEEALSIALYACLAGKTFDNALQIAVLHSGDSDSTGAIAGNMMGLIDPLSTLKHRWALVIEGADIITRLVRDYLRLEHEHDGAEQLARAYPGA
ncbi:putative dual specifity protein phosphatase/ADP-ribosylation/crystallin J1 family protein-fusion protein [Octadecabacter arcticus 238]|uniref:Putative dual specifity protein phosphatase/ADP-ribosylation/crystallin J1 family protein-fusion protein n=1 Tax=Octadecabacter arcticus 238 TaxID=391616 RepID=M9RVN4_9RHOB|nr:ADP-ribosylglycohydrolase family protein [Octadecabacter arcticus]AGI73885.1 putative dual specifity protein phosphatase/ADP-ribosylation/crystallin J1 family protein-fusion protein [Octadecabacter arcticus 238]